MGTRNLKNDSEHEEHMEHATTSEEEKDEIAGESSSQQLSGYITVPVQASDVVNDQLQHPEAS